MGSCAGALKKAVVRFQGSDAVNASSSQGLAAIFNKEGVRDVGCYEVSLDINGTSLDGMMPGYGHTCGEFSDTPVWELGKNVIFYNETTKVWEPFLHWEEYLLGTLNNCVQCGEALNPYQSTCCPACHEERDLDFVERVKEHFPCVFEKNRSSLSGGYELQREITLSDGEVLSKNTWVTVRDSIAFKPYTCAIMPPDDLVSHHRFSNSAEVRKIVKHSEKRNEG